MSVFNLELRFLSGKTASVFLVGFLFFFFQSDEASNLLEVPG